MELQLIASAEAELADIERKTAVMLKRAEQLRAFITLAKQLYGAGLAESLPPPPAPRIVMPPVPQTAAPQKAGSMKVAVEAAAERIISQHGPMQSRPLMERMEAEGLVISGADKMATVSTILSRSDRFKVDRTAGGWVLIQPGLDAAQGAGQHGGLPQGT